MKKILTWLIFSIITIPVFSSQILIPMDNTQTDHLKAYGITYWAIQNTLESYWLLNYKGGSFLIPNRPEIEEICILRNVTYQIISDAEVNSILSYISQNDINMDKIKLVKAPRVAVYAPKTYQPWDDAVMMVLTYAEIPYDVLYDEEILRGDLKNYDWLHLHHEDFTGQYGKFWGSYRNAGWYQAQVQEAEAQAQKLGFAKVSQLKLSVALTIKEYIFNGGFLFAMCSGTDSYDIALAAEGVDICGPMFDGDPMDPAAQTKLDFTKTLAFENFTISTNPYEYEFSNIDVTNYRTVQQTDDYFTLFEFSAKWDPVPTMLCQNHTSILEGFMGQTTAFNKSLIKPNVVIMGEYGNANEARYIHGEYGEGTWTFYGGHDPEDYRHLVGDPPTDLNLHANSPTYRLILNNVLFPAAKKKKQKT
ncbi:MAG: asparagine synthetase B [Bacteroidales bacterium]|nr:asparagine synthetase B [Bacteroidales bacterium]